MIGPCFCNLTVLTPKHTKGKEQEDTIPRAAKREIINKLIQVIVSMKHIKETYSIMPTLKQKGKKKNQPSDQARRENIKEYHSPLETYM